MGEQLCSVAGTTSLFHVPNVSLSIDVFIIIFFRSVPAGQPLHALPQQSFDGVPVCLWIIKHAQGPVGEVSRLPSKDQPGYCAAADPLPLHRCVPHGAQLNLSTLLKHVLVFLVQPFQGTEK